jgi:integrase
MSRRNQGPRLRWLDKRECYYIVWTERGRSRERSTGTADREQAQIKLAEFLQRIDRRTGPRDPSQVFVTDVLIDYQREKETKVVASVRLGYAVTELINFFEGNSVADITTQTCARYSDLRKRRPTQRKDRSSKSPEKPISPGTIRRELGVLRAAVNRAHKLGKITRAVAVELPERPQPRDRWLIRKEAAALIRAARTPQARLYLPLFVLLGLYTGRRKEAILSLRWPQVDLQARTINFDIAGRRRTNKKRGIIPIPPRLLPHLRRAKKRGGDMGYVLHIDGERIKDIKKGFKAACDRAEIDRASPHTLRHTAATWLMQAGVDPWQAAGYLAMSVETLLRTYGHHHPDYQRNAAEAIGRRPQIVRVTG